MAAGGKLEKLRILAFANADYTGEQGNFTAMINPETYTIDYKIDYQEGQGQGTSGAQLRFSGIKPQEFAFELLLDSSGVVDGRPRESVEEDINTLRDLLLKYEGDIHEPKHFKVVWGSLLFKGRCLGMNIATKLFNPGGKPIRAVCKVTFNGSLEDNLRVAEERRSSTDLTHYKTVKDGDTLPLMCYRIYGSSSYYIQVAKVNDISNVRRLVPGTKLFFPPIK